jgi:CRP-like cAMP-binding protein
MSSMKMYRKDEVIAAEGEKARCFYVLVDGKIGVFKNNHKIVEYSKAGVIVGELSRILNRPRNADIIALEDSNLLSIEGEIEEIIRVYPDISKKLIKTLAERLADTTK